MTHFKLYSASWTEHLPLTKVIKDAFNGVAKITKSFQTFFIETMILYLSISKRINFMQMSRFEDSCESRFRSDVSLKYLYFGPKTGKKGRPKEVDDRVDLNDLRMDYFEQVTYEDGEGKETTLYTAVVRATSLKRDVRAVWETAEQS